jgi:tetratricopeptide (TPR) repeat protein
VTHTPSRIVVALLLTLALAAAAPADAPDKPPTKEQIAEWVKGLGSDSFDEREKASKMLWKAGRAAEAALRQVLKDGDAEAIRRAREIVDKFDWGIYPDTPEAVATLIDEYRSGTPESRAGVIPKFLDQGGAGFTALMKIATMEKEPAAKTQIWELLNADMSRLAAALLAEGQDARLAEILEQGLGGEGDQPHANYAAWLMLRGKLDDKVRELEKKGAADRKAALTLAYLCRAKGDLAGARKYAEKAENEELIKTVLVDQEDWKGLLKYVDSLPAPPAGKERLSPGARLACLRLMGDRDGFAAELAKVIADTKDRYTFGVFILNGRIDDGLEWLRKREDHAGAAELLRARLRLREALDEADREKAAGGDGDPLEARLGKAQLLARLGERKKAREVFDKLLADTKPEAVVGSLDTILSAEYGAGFKDEAFARAATLMPKVQEKGDWTALNALFEPADMDTGVEPLWTFLRSKFPQDDAATTLKRMRDLFARKTPAREVADLLQNMADEAAKRKDEERGPWLQCVAEICRALGRDDLREAYLEKWAAAGGDARAWQRLGDIAADAGRWKDAAERYRRGWEKDRGSSLLLYLRGNALVKSGQEKEGRRLMEMAEAIPLGNQQKLAALADGLDEHGMGEAAGRAWERLARITLMNSYYQDSSARGVADGAAAARNYMKAATGARREALYYLWNVVSDTPGSMVWLAANEHRYRARAHAAAGRLDDMRKEVDAVLDVEPDIELAIDVVTELTKRGHKKEADELFGRVYAANEAVCKDYPNSAWAHNNVAWLAVRCKRNLDAALGHARKAVEAEPDMSSYLDTLAEVYFQRGDKGKAVELEKKCVVLQPAYAYFRKQVKRMQAGDRDAELPAESATATLSHSLVELP